ncbi:tetratricopeptide repeat protein [Nonomuraea sp. K274]|uniref:Tetratricopeptide repeat protein n=1 Tax=Nonomuraea cypriaca TaxID=1187855 RepID=A0A931F269_9ACTN|nr:FxSxx-COOH system tetratricopeptide repeat protein [Nonomuraea cypriaca]MBF8191255.1 tetratricopeptide repeat protein [Nonomuraea cypriaca]
MTSDRRVEALAELRARLRAIDPGITTGELADVLWLACHLTPGATETGASGLLTGEPDAPTVSAPGRDGVSTPPESPGPARPATASSPKAALHALDGGGDAEGGESARRVQVPAASTLDDVLGIQRALRPIKSRVPSRRLHVLDEQATADRIAHTKQWVPVMEGFPERWLDLALVVDSGPSMAVWQPLVRELRDALVQLGAFRDVRVHHLVGDGVAQRHGGPAAPPETLIDPSRRRVVLVLSDCSGGHWWDGRAPVMLRGWALAMPTAVLQPLPERMWRRTAMPGIPGSAKPTQPGSPNTGLAFAPREGQAEAGAIPVPLLRLDPSWLGDWARLVAGMAGDGLPVSAALVQVAIPSGERRIRQEAALTAADKVRRFRSVASPQAATLAAYVATSIASLPVIRLIQQRMFRRPLPEHLAELLLSGLLRPVGGDRYAFVDGAREALLATVPRAESWRAVNVLRQVSGEVERRAGTATETFTALLKARGEAGGARVGAGDRPFALISAEAVRILDDLSIPLLTSSMDPAPLEAAPRQVTGRREDPKAHGPATTTGPARTSQPRHGLPVIGRNMPSRNRNFVGREALFESLRSRFVGVEGSQPEPQALVGFGGVGKTQAAIEYAWRNMADYDLVLWVSAGDPALVPTALASMAPLMNLPSAQTQGFDEAARAVCTALERGEPFDRWLLIFDSADEPEAITSYLPQGQGHILITSRNGRWRDVCSTTEVGVFSREESLRFLTRRLQRAVPDDEADRLASGLGDLPLALEQAVALQVSTGMPVAEYLDVLSTQTGSVLGMGKSASYPHSMTAAWRLTLDQVGAQLPEAVEIFRRCAFFGPAPIPRRIFRTRQTDSPLRAVLADPILLARALSLLDRFALIRVDHEAGTIEVHRLLQALTRGDIAQDARLEMRHEVHLLLAAGAPKSPEDTRDWPSFQQLLPHIGPSELEQCAEAAVRAFALGMVRYLYLSANYPLAEHFAHSFAATWTETGGPHDRDALVARRHLGDVTRALGRYAEAYEIDRDSTEATREVFGLDHPESLAASAGYGASLRARGEFLAARDVDSELLNQCELVFGSTHDQTQRAASNLALDHLLIGEYGHAEELYKRAYLEQSAAEAAQVDLLASWNGLARALRLAGTYSDARDIAEEAFAHAARELTVHHHLSLLTAKDLSIAMRKGGDIPEALELARDTHSRLLMAFGEQHPDTIGAAVAFSNTLREMGDLDEATSIAVDVVKHCLLVYGSEHPFRHGCAMNLALLRRLRGDLVDARRLDEEALTGLSGRLGRHHPYALACAINLQSDLALLGETERAVALGETTYDLLRSSLGGEHVLTLACASNLALDQRAIEADAQEGLRTNCDFDPIPL